MQKLTEQQLEAHGLDSIHDVDTSFIMEALLNLEVGDYLLISKEDWDRTGSRSEFPNWISSRKYMEYSRLNGKDLSYRTVDGGWLVKYKGERK